MADDPLTHPSRTEYAISLAVGIPFSLVLVRHAHTLGYPVFGFDDPIKHLPFIALTVLGAVSMLAMLRFRLLTPSVVVALVVVNWLRSEADPGPGNPFIALIWLLPLWIVAIVVAAIERWIRVSRRPTLVNGR